MVATKHKRQFKTASLYRTTEPAAFSYLKEKRTFWIAVLSLFTFVSGNMMGQHGLYVFWRSVLGSGLESAVVYTGTESPIEKIPDYARWAKLGGNVRDHTYREVPQDYLIPLPPYLGPDASDGNVYMVDQLGTYSTGRGQGSHPGVDIAVPQGTPVRAMANGIIERAANDPAGYGNYVVIKHPNFPDPTENAKLTTVYSVYAHLQSILVTEGDLINKGQLLGASGKTGFATGPHLHFQIDLASAPWHPYWPFTGAEARSAGLTLAQAVDKGLHRERGLEFTTHPMLYVQAHTDDGTRIVKADTPAPAANKRLTVSDRRRIRMAKLQITSTSIVALNDSTPPAPVPVPSTAQEAASIMISHDGSFSAERGREKVSLRLLDASGNTVTKVSNDKRVYFETIYGKAQFFPESVMLSDFGDDGKLDIEMLPLGQQTVIVKETLFNTVSKPLARER